MTAPAGSPGATYTARPGAAARPGRPYPLGATVTSGGTNFAVTGTSLGRDWAILGAGLNWNLGRGWQTYANYDAQVNVSQVFHVGSGGFQYSW